VAYPTITYDATNGSDTAPSDLVASGGSASGTGAATSIALGTTADLSDCAQDGSDYIRVGTASGDRHLFQVTGVTGTWSAATAVTVAEAIDTTFSGADWYVNGTRQTLDADTCQPDCDDWMPGWTIEFTGETHSTSYLRPGEDSGAGAQSLPITLKAKSGEALRPVIEFTANTYALDVGSGISVTAIGLKWTNGTGAGANSFIYTDGQGHLYMEDCVIDTSASSANYAVYLAGTYQKATLIGCYLTGGENSVLIDAIARCGAYIYNCVFDGANGAGTYGTVRIATDQASLAMERCLVFDADVDGIVIDHGDEGLVSITNCTIVDSDGDGITVNATTPSDMHTIVVRNCLIAYNGGYGIQDDGTSSPHQWHCDYNALYSNTSGNYGSGNGVEAGPNDVTLTADPFVHRASNNYALNNTAGAGAAAREVAYPANLPSGA
jgi:hypothetical protein